MNKVINPGQVRWDGRQHTNVFIRIKTDEKGELHITGVEGPMENGNARGSAGQIVMSYTPEYVRLNFKLNSPWWTQEMFRELLDVWNKWHLNHMNAGTVKQTEFLRAHRREGSDYTSDKELLKSYHLDPDPETGYVYGSAWLKEDLPADIVEFLEGLPETNKTYAWV